MAILRQKVLLVTSCYPRNEQDNSGIFLRYLARYLAKKGLEIHILSPADAKLETTLFDQKVKVHRFRYLPRRMQRLAYGSGILPNLRGNRWLILQLPFFAVGQLVALLYWCRKLHPQVIHAHWLLPQGLIAVAVGKLFAIPIITTAHGGDAFALQGGITAHLKRWTIRHTDCWTANSRATSCAIGQVTKPPVIIPMGIETTLFHPGVEADQRMQVTNDTHTILFVGRLVEKKGVCYLLDAFAHLSASRQSTTRLYIIGDGILKRDLQSQARILGIDEQVEFLGNIPNQQLPACYCAADLFVAPSIQDKQGDTEGLGVILLEAMACGTAIIASAIGGITEVIQDRENGLLVSPANSAMLAATIERALQDQDMRCAMAKTALLTVEQHYQWKKISDDFSTIYDQCIANACV